MEKCQFNVNESCEDDGNDIDSACVMEDNDNCEESVTCLLEDNDMQCGHIFYNEETRILKYYCTFCRETYENINIFCCHLSEHINGEMTEATDDTNIEGTNVDSLEESSYIDSCERFNSLDDIHESITEHNETNSECMTEIPNEVGDENSDLYDCEVNSFQNNTGSLQKQMSGILNESNSNSNEEKHQRAKVVNLDLLRKKKKRITTVKVIAVKNRITELYEKIKNEEEKRSQISSCKDDMVSKSNTNSHTNLNDPANSAYEKTSTMAQSKIIGETLITLLPNNDTMATPIPSVSTVPNENSNENSLVDKERTCLACGKEFRSSYSLAIHKRSHYLESDNNIKLAHKCPDCNQLFNKIQELKEHVKNVHYPDGFICNICNKKLSRLSLLELHMRKVHLARPFTCDICKKSFSSRETYEVHVNSHMVGEDYRCHICGRKYPTEIVLQYHKKRHKEPVPQCCVVCGKMTLRITQHMKIHTPRPKRILSCSVCGKVFNFSSGLSHHFKVMHKQPRPPKSPNKLVSPSKCGNTQNKRKARKEKNVRWDNMRTPDVVSDMSLKEEEAKRVIVELIQNASYAPYFPDNQYEAPPIAREETITAISSIVNDDLESDVDVK